MMASRRHWAQRKLRLPPLKSSNGEVITDKDLQLERRVEHYSDLYSRENIVSPIVRAAIECLPVMEELD